MSHLGPVAQPSQLQPTFGPLCLPKLNPRFTYAFVQHKLFGSAFFAQLGSEQDAPERLVNHWAKGVLFPLGLAGPATNPRLPRNRATRKVAGPTRGSSCTFAVLAFIALMQILQQYTCDNKQHMTWHRTAYVCYALWQAKCTPLAEEAKSPRDPLGKKRWTRARDPRLFIWAFCSRGRLSDGLACGVRGFCFGVVRLRPPFILRRIHSTGHATRGPPGFFLPRFVLDLCFAGVYVDFQTNLTFFKRTAYSQRFH